MGGEAILAGMAGTGIIDRNIGTVQASLQHRRIFGAENLQPFGQQAHHLALGDDNAHAIQQGHDPLASDLAGK